MAGSDLTIVLVAALISGLFSGVLVFVLGEYFARRREQRNQARAGLAFAHNFYYREYLHQDIKDCRSRLQETTLGAEDDARRLSVALQRIGCAAHLDVIPLPYVLNMNATQIVSDWVLLKQYISTIVPAGANWKLVQFPRRHAEWLVLTAWSWLKRCPFDLANCEVKSLQEFTSMYSGERLAKKRMRALTRQLKKGMRV
ncbi:MAG: hypothetical protein JSU86_14180 [Phycisphaerales bacterium]|nr:MAG: hypothetical protein JSU86_14180 [Phycisphaerales bacterium]